MIRDTSRIAYDDLRASGALPECEQKVLDVLVRYAIPMTNKEVAVKLGKEAGWVSARRSALIAKGMLEEAPKRCCSITGKWAMTWQIKRHKPAQIELFES